MARAIVLLVVALLALVMAGVEAGLPSNGCKTHKRSYHLSCYAKSVSQSTAIAAKKECWAAWGHLKDCKPQIEFTGSHYLGCDTGVVYSFANDACRKSYQGQEKKNSKCFKYIKAKMGDPKNRDTTTKPGGADYDCK